MINPNLKFENNPASGDKSFGFVIAPGAGFSIFGEVDMKNEEWKNIKGWEGYYKVSSHGRVRSIKRKVIHKNGFIQTIAEKTLAGSVARNGYIYVDLRKGDKRSNTQVHRLVLEAFVGPCPLKNESRHIDGTRTNNHVNNLRYGTRQDNVDDAKRHGRTPTGDNHWNVKIPDSEVVNIRNSKEPSSVLAERYGVSWMAIYDIKAGRRRSSIV